MSSTFDWQKNSRFERGKLLEYWESRLPLKEDAGSVFTALIARVDREVLEGDQAEVMGADELFYPALYLEVRHAFEVVVAGSLHQGFEGSEPLPLFMSALRDVDLAFLNKERTDLLEDVGKKKREELRHAAIREYFALEGEYSFGDAEDVLRGFIRDVVAGMRADAFKFQEEFGGDVLSVTEVAELFAVPRNTVLNWIKSGTLRGFRLGSKWMIERKDLAAAVAQAKTTSTKS